MNINDELNQAWQRVLADRAMPGDGMKVILWLRSKQLAVSPIGIPSCAVHDLEGQRRLASDILRFAEPAEHDPSRDATDASADLAVQRARRRDHPAAERSRGARRRVADSG